MQSNAPDAEQRGGNEDTHEAAHRGQQRMGRVVAGAGVWCHMVSAIRHG